MQLARSGPPRPHHDESGRCELCGLLYAHDSPEDRHFHRAWHRAVLPVVRPRPDRLAIRALAQEDDPERVTARSLIWKHNRLYAIALQLRRELRLDSTMWGIPINRKPTDGFDHDDLWRGRGFSHGRGFLFLADGSEALMGSVLGGCAFRWREWAGAPAAWALQWAWVAPPYRRQGVLTRRWPRFRSDFGLFGLEQPLSEPMQAFAASRAADQPKV